MIVGRSRIWRALFVVGGVLYLGGSAQHPRGTMAEMMAAPAWVPGHTTVFAGLLVLTLGLVLFRRTVRASASMDRWLRFSIVATALEAVEMAVHTVAYVDVDALTHGHATPVLTSHLWLATAIYPLFAVSLIGLIWHGQREGSLGSSWIAWIGMLGAVAHGIVMWLVYIFEVFWAPILFPVAAILLSLWFVLAGVWPSKMRDAQPIVLSQ
ncbi:MAG: hypothetical protein M3R55_00410 [Acidobacteriota bacterium]|nr:hypothetical protein [Acidobacteriota bacterium]